MKRFNLALALTSLLIDIAAILLALILAYLIRADGVELYQWPFNSYLRFVGLSLPVWVVVLASLGLYSPTNPLRGTTIISRLFVGLMSGWAVVLITLYLWRSPEAQNFPRLIIVYGVFLTFGLVGLGRLILSGVISLMHRSGLGVSRSVLITGAASNGFITQMESRRHPDREIVSVIRQDHLPALAKLLNNQRVDELIIADPSIPETTQMELLALAESRNLSFSLIPSLLSVRTTNVEIGSIQGLPVMYFKRTPLEGWGRVYKRLLDIILVIPALVIALPFLLLLAIAVRLSSPGPILYREPRVGQNGRTFYVYKFRSMYADWRQRFPDIKDWSNDEKTDPRITNIGRIIRRTNLDELPQLWSVLAGSMSLVGPRPEQPKYVEAFSKEIPAYLRRHHVKSGLTGWAQINGARGNTPVAERVKYDIYYVENWSIWFDIRIILATFVYLFRHLVNPA